LKAVIHITVIGSTAAMRGTVRSPQDKRLCLECCRHVPGVTRVVDDLIVDDEGTGG
jgi:osmotically-inducible protein OsmY